MSVINEHCYIKNQIIFAGQKLYFIIIFLGLFFSGGGGGRKIQVCSRAPDTLATPLAQRNSFINGIGLTEANSLIHLLNNDDTDDDNELNLVKHSAYYGENEFSKML